jgi:hypothetical protein
LETVRTISDIVSNKLVFDVPPTDSYDQAYLGPGGTAVVRVEEKDGSI